MQREPLISLAMIVRNEAEGLARCLASAAAGVDEIIVVDTGSSDDTKAIAAAFTRHVYDDLWDDDFAGARNRAYDCATGDWIVTLDGDDELIDACALRALVAAAPADVGAIMLQYVTGRDEHGNIVQVLWRERLTRRGHYTWKGRVHEALVATSGLRRIQSNQAMVIHHGKRARSEGSLERNVRILGLELTAAGDRPDPRSLFYLARDLMLLGDESRAIATFARYLKVGTWVEELYAAWLFTARMRLGRGERPYAAAAAHSALQLDPSRPEAYFLLGELAYYEGDWGRTIAWCELGSCEGTHAGVLFNDPMAVKYKWIIFYVVALCHFGRLAEALAWTRRALELVPTDPQHLQNLAFLQAAAAATG